MNVSLDGVKSVIHFRTLLVFFLIKGQQYICFYEGGYYSFECYEKITGLKYVKLRQSLKTVIVAILIGVAETQVFASSKMFVHSNYASFEKN